jgi:cation transport ATPase
MLQSQRAEHRDPQRISPVFAGAAMALSSVSVVTNALRLKGARAT